MSRIQSLRRRLGLAIAGIRAAAGDSYERFRPWFEPRNIFARLRTGKLATSETIFAAISMLSNSMGSMPLALFDRDSRRVNNNASDVLLFNPSPNLHLFEFVRTMEALRNSAGNAYALKDYDARYQVSAFRILDPSRVVPVIERTTRELWYEVTGDNGQKYYVHNMDMLHLRHISVEADASGISYQGVSPLDVLKNAIDFDGKVKEFSLDQLDSAVMPSFILNLATMLGDDGKKQVLDNFKAFYAENGGVLLEEQGTAIREIERKSFIDTQLAISEKITVRRVATVFGLPAHRLGDTDGVSYNSREQAALEYVQDTILSIVAQWVAELNRKLLTLDERRAGLSFRFDFTQLMRADTATLGDFLFKMIRTAVFTPNQALASLGQEPYADGDVHYVSRDLSPVGSPQTPPPTGR